MIYRTLKRLLWVIAGLCLLVAVLGGLFLWRLSVRPIHLGFLRSPLENALASLSGRSIDVADTVLAWDVEGSRVDLRARQVTIRDADNVVLATIPAVDVSLSVPALLRRRLALTAVDIEGAQVTLIRTTDGAILFGSGPNDSPDPGARGVTGATEAPDVGEMAAALADVLDSLLCDSVASHPLASLHTVQVGKSVLTLYDRQHGVTWQAPSVDIALRRDGQKLSGQLQATIAWQQARTDFSVKVSYSQSAPVFAIEAGFTDLYAAAFSPALPALNAVARLDLPGHGQLALVLDRQGQLQEFNFELHGGPGSASMPQVLPHPLPVVRLTVRGRLDQRPDTLRLDEATVTIGTAEASATLRLSGIAEGLGGDVTVTGQARLDDLHLADLKPYWPAATTGQLPVWLVQARLAARLEQARANGVFIVPDGDLGAAAIKRLDGSLGYRLAQQKAPARGTANWSYNPATKQFTVDTTFADLQALTLAAVVPEPSLLQGIKAPFKGTIGLTLGSAGRLRGLHFDIAGGPGALSLPGVMPVPRPLASVAARGRFDGLKGVLRLDAATVAMGTARAAGPRLKMSGRVVGLGGEVSITAQVRLKAFQITDLQYYWPASVFDKARFWLLKNLAAGSIEAVRAQIGVTLPRGKGGARVDKLAGAIQFHGMEVHYLRPLPPLLRVKGTASFDPSGFRIKVVSGEGAGLRLTGGEVQITGLDVRRDAMRIRVGIDTPVRAALTLLDHEPLKLLSGLGIDPVTTGGQASVQTEFAFPLIGSVDFEDVEVQVRGTIEDASVRRVFLGQDAEHGRLTLRLDQTGLRLQGPVDFAGVPLRLDWRQAFSKGVAWKSTYHLVASRVQTSDLTRFGVAPLAFVEGPFAATVVARLGWQGQSQVQATLNLQDTALSLPYLGWRKAAGEPGEAAATLQLVDGRMDQLSHLKIKTDTLTTSGMAQFDRAGRTVARLELRGLELGRSRLAGVQVQWRQKEVDILIGEGVLDVQPLLSQPTDTEQPTVDRTTHAADVSALGESETKQQTVRLYLQAPALRRVYFAADRYLEDVAVKLTHSHAGWELIDITGQAPASLVRYAKAEDREGETVEPPQPRTLSVKYGPSPHDTYALSVQTNDAGAVLRACNIIETVIGGRLTIQGQTVGAGPGGVLQATIRARRFRLKRAPLVVRLLAAASFTGVLNTLNGEGLAFSKLSGEVSLADTTLGITSLRLRGGALGLTAKGTVHLSTGSIDVKGTVVPFYAVNSLVGEIPLLGKLLVGGKGQGIVAITYRLRGKLADPQVVVNPAAALTPGFLRGIFDLLDGSEGEAVELRPRDETAP
ncbi:hypothetical protein NKDENANG_00053 [Candidatus Entotheonellaceae bacterium PAL068K]